VSASTQDTKPPPTSQSSTKSRTPYLLNRHNLQSNFHWGPELLEEKPYDIFCLYFQNVNGLRLGNNGLDILDFFCHMRSIGADVIGASEINLDANHPFVRQALHRHRNQVWEHSRIATSSSHVNFGTTRKPGGTLLGITGNTTGRVIAQHSDKLGRFSAITLLGRLGRRITIISAYQTPQNSSSAGITTAHHQQVLQLKKDGATELLAIQNR
jgi:hypothetical protein